MYKGKRKIHTYTEYEQINLEQLNNLVNIETLNDITGVPVKFSDENEYTYLTVSEFKELYNTLTRNKYFHLFYVKEYNKYISTLTNIDTLRSLSYETGLPEEYRLKIEEQLNKLFSEEE